MRLSLLLTFVAIFSVAPAQSATFYPIERVVVQPQRVGPPSGRVLIDAAIEEPSGFLDYAVMAGKATWTLEAGSYRATFTPTNCRTRGEDHVRGRWIICRTRELTVRLLNVQTPTYYFIHIRSRYMAQTETPTAPVTLTLNWPWYEETTETTRCRPRWAGLACRYFYPPQ